MTIPELQVSHLWRYGPDWLRTSILPNKAVCTFNQLPEECYTELRVSCRKHTTLLLTCLTAHYGNLQKLLRVTAYVLRGVRCFKIKRANQTGEPLIPEELADAKIERIRDGQGELEQQKSFSSLKLQLNLFLNQKKLWRCGGCLANTNTVHPRLSEPHWSGGCAEVFG